MLTDAFYVNRSEERFTFSWDRTKILFSENPEKSFFLIRLAVDLQHGIPRFPDGILQLFIGNIVFGNNGTLALGVRGCHLPHPKRAPYRFIYMCFAHSAHHSVYFHCYLCHFIFILYGFRYSAPLRASTISIFLFFAAIITLTASDTPNVRIILTAYVSGPMTMRISYSEARSFIRTLRVR